MLCGVDAYLVTLNARQIVAAVCGFLGSDLGAEAVKEEVDDSNAVPTIRAALRLERPSLARTNHVRNVFAVADH